MDAAEDNKIWYEDPAGFWAKDNWKEFVPNKRMGSYARILNSIVRFALYYTVLAVLLTRNVKHAYMLLFALVLTFVLWENRSSPETFDAGRIGGRFTDAQVRKACGAEDATLPTKENPFMNVTMDEYSKDPQRPKACKLTNKIVASKAEEYFEDNLYRDADDIFQRNTSSRQFYTTPITTIPNDQTSFANWLYKTGPTHKERHLVA